MKASDFEIRNKDKCPPATQDITLNLKNRQKAIDEYGYGPLNPDLPNRKFWMAKVDEWNLDSPEEAKSSLCGNCAAFDQRKATLDCIAQGIGSDQGAEDPTIDAGDLGYCRFLKFKCASRRTCDAWVTGGPITENFVEEAVANTNFDPKRSLNLIARSIDEVLQTQRKARGLLNVHDIIKRIKEALYYTGNTEHTIPGKYFVLLYKQVKRAEKMNQHPRPDDPAPQAAALSALRLIRNETIPVIQQLLNQSVNENLRDWFGKEKWVRMDTKGNIKGPCARGSAKEGKPKCLPQAKAHALGKKGRAAAAQKKRREDPNPNRRGPAKNVATKVNEQSTRRDPKDLTAPTDQELDKLHHKFIPAWSMLDHDLLATAYDFVDDDTALSYVNQLHDIEQMMDHNAVITVDNARVSIKVRTSDIDGLSRLDFEFALRADDLAHQLKADQLPHATNSVNEQRFDENCWKGYHKEGNKKMFGKTVPNCVKNEGQESCPECGGAMYPDTMINEKQDACYYKVKSRYKVWPSAYASGALVQCRKKGASNWGNKSKGKS